MLTRSGGSRYISMPNIFKICRSVAKILRFFDFSKWRPSPSWIFKFVKFHWQTVSGGPRLIIVLKVVKIGLSVTKILQFFEFSKWLPPPFSIFQNREILLAIGVQRVEVHHHAKFRQNRSIACENTKIFHDGGRRPSWICLGQIWTTHSE